MSNKKPTYEELERRLIDTEAIVTTLRRGEVDAIISERKVALLRVAELEKALRSSEENFRNSLEKSPLGICIITAEGEILYANQAMLDICGYSSVEELKAMPTKDRYIPQSYAEHQERKEKRKRGEFVPSNYEISIVRKDGEVRHLAVSRAEVTWNNERQFEALYHDITKRKRLEKRLLKARNELEMRVAERTAELEWVARELRTEIAEREQAEEALRQSEKKYKALFEGTLDGVVVVDETMKLLLANQAAADIIGFDSVEKLLEANPFDLIPTDERERVLKLLTKDLFEWDMQQVNEFRLINKAGKEIWVSAFGTPIEYQGKVAGLASFRDITERKQMEETLRECQRAIEGSPDLIAIVDQQYVHRIVNKTFLRYHSLSRDRVVGHTVAEVLGEDVFETRIKPKIDRCLQGKTIKYEMKHRYPEVGERTLHLSYYPLKSSDEEVTAVVAVISDITERKQAEEEVREQRDRAQKYFDIAGVMLVVIDADQKVSLINEKGCEILGYEEKEIIGKNWFDTFIPERHRDEVRAVFEKLTAGKLKPVEYFENRVLNKRGEERIIAWHNAVLKDDEGEMTATLSSGEDITERKQSEERLARELAATTAVVNDMLRGEVDDAETEKKVLDACLTATDSVYGMIGVINEQGEYDTTTYSSQTLQDCAYPEARAWEISRGMTIRGIWGWPMLHGEPLICNDLEAHPDRVGFPKGHVTLLSFLGVPLKRDGKVVGMVAVANKPGGYTVEDRNTLIRLASTITVSRQHRLAIVAANRKTAELEQLVAERTKQLREDITERKHAQEALRKAHDELEMRVAERTADLARKTEELRSSHDYLKKLTDSMWDAVFSVKMPERVIEWANDSFRLTGYEPEECIGKTTQFLYPDDRGFFTFGDKLKSAIAEGNDVLHTEQLLKRKNGEVFPADVTTTFFKEKDKFVRVTSIIRDITERKKLDQLKDDFIGLVSHELRSPLTVITGAVNTVLTEGAALSPEETRQLLQDAALEADSLSHLLGNLLELSRVQANRLFLDAEAISVKKLIQDTVEEMKSQSSVHQFIVHLPRKTPVVYADQLRVERILYNLLENAVKYSPQGGEIRVSVKPERGDLVIGVSDQGVGISLADQAKLFAPFQRLEESRLEGGRGLGLGLLVCRRLVEAHSGRIWVESEPSRGSNFFFTLPLAHTLT